MSDDKAIRPFHLEIDEDTLIDLRERLARTRFPEPETVSAGGTADWSQGVPLAYIIELRDYWLHQYDWRRVESELNGHGQWLTEIDGIDIHFLHVRSSRPGARAIVLTHGWPGSLVESLDVLEGLTSPPEGEPAFHVVVPSLPGFGFGGKPTATGWNVERIADAWVVLMQRLGYDRFFAVGGDWGGRVTSALGARHPERVEALHTATPFAEQPAGFSDEDLSPMEAAWMSDTREFWRSGSGYAAEQSTRPQTIGYGLVDSPVAQLAWIVEKFYFWTDCRGHPENTVSRDRILDNVMAYWLTATGASAARIYWECSPPEDSTPVTVPAAITIFAHDMEKLPRAWIEKRYLDVRRFTVVDRGGHFPMLEVPDLFVSEVRAAFAHPAQDAKG